MLTSRVLPALVTLVAAAHAIGAAQIPERDVVYTKSMEFTLEDIAELVKLTGSKTSTALPTVVFAKKP